ncbi:MAG: M15 family metallopeptidase [bacterium]
MQVKEKCVRFLELRGVLPRNKINAIPIQDNGETLVEIVETEKLRIARYATKDYRCREKVYGMLKEVSNNLPAEFTLIFVEGFRSRERQQELWNRALLKAKEMEPDAGQEEVERIARLFAAKPVGLGGGHQTGGAIDVTLGDKNGNELFLGTKVQEFSEKTPMFARTISKKECEFRDILLNAMVKAGFQNYPAEWWHYSYGDRLWAAYGKHTSAFYGPM